MIQQFSEEHDNPTDCQLVLCFTGNQEQIKLKLREFYLEMEKGEKPMQGTIMQYNLKTSVITPIWNGKTY